MMKKNACESKTHVFARKNSNGGKAVEKNGWEKDGVDASNEFQRMYIVQSNCFRNMSAGVQRSFCTLNEKFYLFLLSYSKRCIYMLMYNCVFVSFWLGVPLRFFLAVNFMFLCSGLWNAGAVFSVSRICHFNPFAFSLVFIFSLFFCVPSLFRPAHSLHFGFEDGLMFPLSRRPCFLWRAFSLAKVISIANVVVVRCFILFIMPFSRYVHCIFVWFVYCYFVVLC